MTIRTILLPVDFSHPAKVAACQARLLAEHFAAHLKLLHVLPYPLAMPGAPEHGLQLGEWFTGRSTQDAVELKSFFAQELKGVPVERVVLEGDPAKRIVGYANANDVDLIVMPAHGYGPFRRFLLGSVTAKVLHDVDCPVWTGIHAEDVSCGETLNIRTVVCAVGLGPESAKLIGWASEAATSFGARLFLVHVIPDPEPGDDGQLRPGLMDSAAVRARERAEELKRHCAADAEVIIAGGEIHKAVRWQLEKLSADLLIIGRSPQAGIFGRLPTNAYAIVRDSRCPVVSV
jgi:nucleotide-binding universal stress UspA family protein